MSKKVVTKSLVINHLNESIGLSKKECQYFLESFLEVIFFELKNHSDVKIVNFGIFKIKNKKPRIGRNPKTRQEVIISERNEVVTNLAKLTFVLCCDQKFGSDTAFLFFKVR